MEVITNNNHHKHQFRNKNNNNNKKKIKNYKHNNCLNDQINKNWFHLIANLIVNLIKV